MTSRAMRVLLAVALALGGLSFVLSIFALSTALRLEQQMEGLQTAIEALAHRPTVDGLPLASPPPELETDDE